MIDRVGRRHTLEGLVVDPIEGAFTGELVVEGGTIAEVRRVEGGAVEPLVFPGFIDLQVYDPADLGSTGVTGYLLATRTLEEVDDPLCLGLHLEGPFLNPEAAGAIPVEELTPVDLSSCKECGAKLTERELEQVLESGGPALCTVHAQEDVAVSDEEALGEEV